MLMDKTKPCNNCPFRSDVMPYLTVERAEEIAVAITKRDLTFSCHKTVKNLGSKAKEESHCAGAAIMLEKMQLPNQHMRIMERIGMYDRSKLDMKAPVYNNATEFVTATAIWNGYIDEGEEYQI